MKQILALLIVVACILLLCGCGDSDSRGTETKNGQRAIVRLPDDTLVTGKVDGYSLVSYGLVRVMIHGTTYTTGVGNVCIIE